MRASKDRTELTYVDRIAEAVRTNRLSMEKAARPLFESAPLVKSRYKRSRKGANMAARKAMAKVLCPWRDEKIVESMREAARDSRSLDAAFGKAFWHPGAGLEPGKQWVWW